ncbi:MAG TPA: TerB family tellurite resistance protein [Candidatus Limnocylindrales bacterium]
MPFRRFLGLSSSIEPGQADPAETETVRRIVARLESLPADQARLLAATAYVLARAANADFDISDVETRTMERLLTERGGLDEAQAVLVVEMAKLQALAAGETEDYLVTREFRNAASREERLAVLRACYAVAAADESISAMESATLNEIAGELDLQREEVATIRAEFGDKVAARRALHG